MPQTPSRPWQSRQEMLIDEALNNAISDRDTIENIRPVVPQQLFPEIRGFAKHEQGIMEVLSTGRSVPTYRSWVSGAPVMFRNGFIDEEWSGSSRYSMQSLGM